MPIKIKKVEKRFKRNWTLLNYSGTFDIELELKQGFSSLIYEFLKLFSEHGFFTDKHLKNIQGRENNDFKFKTAESFKADLDNKELLLITGSIPDQDLDIEESSFYYRITTQFDSFLGNDTIINTSNLATSDNLSPVLKLDNIAYVAPLEIKSFRLGIEFFQKRSLSSILSLAPVVTETLYIEAYKDKMHIKLWSEKLKNKKSLPLSQKNFSNKFYNLIHNPL